jgi:hypothetical protein
MIVISSNNSADDIHLILKRNTGEEEKINLCVPFRGVLSLGIITGLRYSSQGFDELKHLK